MIPIVAGLLMGAAMGGGIAALQKKDILQGALMGGIGGALGGAFMPGVAGAAAGEAGAAAAGSGFGATGLSQGATAGAVNAFESQLPGMASGITGTGGTAGIGAMAPMGAGSQGLASLGGAVPTATPFSLPNFLTQNKYALAGGVAGGMMAPGEAPPSPEQGNIRDYTFSQQQNPLFGQPGQNYFSNQGYTAGAVTPVEDYTAANGGIIALAEGGQTDRYSRPMRTVDPAVTAYNAQLMEMANQQYNVNPRPGPNQVPGSVGYLAPPPPVATPISIPAASSSDEFRFNPVTQQYEGQFATPSEKKRPVFDMEEAPQAPYYNHAAGDGGANGGMPGRDFGSYAGGGLSSLGAYSDGGQLLKGPGDGVSDSIPARIGARQPARLADGEFVVPARIVSEIGNGSTDAGAKRLYAMMDRVQKGRKKSIGKGKVAVDSKAHKLLPA